MPQLSEATHEAIAEFATAAGGGGGTGFQGNHVGDEMQDEMQILRSRLELKDLRGGLSLLSIAALEQHFLTEQVRGVPGATQAAHSSLPLSPSNATGAAKDTQRGRDQDERSGGRVHRGSGQGQEKGRGVLLTTPMSSWAGLSELTQAALREAKYEPR